MNDFIKSARSIAFGIIAGNGGSGKTRLALELCKSLQNKGWNAGFLRQNHIDTELFFQRIVEGEWRNDRETLIVIDYAASMTQQIQSLLKMLSGQEKDWHIPLRILLLERHADFNAGWLKTICGNNSNEAYVLRRMFSGGIFTLSPLDINDSLVLFLEMCKHLRHLSLSPAEVQYVRRGLSRASWSGEPLYVMMAAMCWSRKSSPSLVLNRHELAFCIAEMEENKYDKLASAEKINGDILKYLAACVTLAQGLDRNGFYNFIDVQSEKNTWLAELSNNDAEIYFNALHLSRNHLTYDSVKNKNSPMNICDLRPIEPDVIGEAFILKQLSLRRAKDTPLACHSIFNEAVVQVIIRIIQDFSELHDENHPTDKNVKKRAELPLNWLENIINQSKDDIHKLTQIASAFPSRSIALTDIALKVHKVIRQSLVAKNPDAFMPDLAVSLNNLTILLRENGNVPHALENAFEGLRICRFLYCSS